jgi:hypothetical protein
MPDEQARERQCRGKVRYPSLDEAKDQAKRLHKKCKASFNTCPCPWCNGWHVGTDRSPRQQARRNG